MKFSGLTIMKEKLRVQLSNELRHISLFYLALFSGLWVYFGFFIDYVLFFQEKSSLFILSADFLTESLYKPGGALIYLGKLLSAFFYYSASGAAIVSGGIVLSVFTISKIFSLLEGLKGFSFSVLIGAAMFYLNTDYHFLFYNITGLLLPLLFFCLVIRYINFGKGWLPVSVFPFVYLFLGGFAWIFLLMITSYYLVYCGKRGLLKVLVLWFSGILIIYLSKEYIYYETVRVLVSFPFSEVNNGSGTVLLIIVAGILAVLPFIIKYSYRSLAWLDALVFKRTISFTVLFIFIFLFISWQGYDRKAKHYFYVEKLFYQGRYDELINFNINNPPTNSLTLFLNNIALCERNKLDDLLFDFKQDPSGGTLFLKWEMNEEILRRGGYFYYTVGMINEANRWAFENLVMKGLTPEGLKMLIKTELINGNFIVASRYNDILGKTIFYGKCARKFEKMLFNASAVQNDPELGEKARIRPKKDFFILTDKPEVNLDCILYGDSLNKKALDYKMAYLLLRKDSEGIMESVNRYRTLGVTKLPGNVEEAVVAYLSLNKARLDNQVFPVSRTIEERWRLFMTVLRKYGSDPKPAEPLLKKQFANTFWYYAVYM